MKVVAPSNPADAYGLLRSCIEDDDPCLFIENLPSYWTSGPAPAPGHKVALGKGRVVTQGSDVTVVTYSRMVQECVAAIGLLSQRNVSVEVIDLRTISPWDEEVVMDSVAKTGRALIVHEAVTNFGVGAEIAARVASAQFGRLKRPVARLGAPYAPVPSAKVLEQAYAPNAQKIAQSILHLVQ
jgi:acetoin:2,6-dichlorophenolindophenol oxidoreductase subunit beta